MNPICQATDQLLSGLPKVLEVFPIGDLVKTASVDDNFFSGLPNDAFAWPEKRQFPIVDKEQTLLSLGYSKFASELPTHVTETLQRAAEIYDIDTSIFNVQIKVAQDNGQYLLPEDHKFKVTNAADIQQLENLLMSKMAGVDEERRFVAGFNLVKIAGDMGVSLNPSTIEAFGLTVTDTSLLSDYLVARKYLTKNAECAAAYNTLAEAVSKLPALITEEDAQVKLAMVITQLDEAAGIRPLYYNTVVNPIKTVCNTGKLASQFIKIASTVYSNEVLNKVPITFWEDILGKEGVAEVAPGGVINLQALQQVISTLPADLKKVVDAQLSPYAK